MARGEHERHDNAGTPTPRRSADVGARNLKPAKAAEAERDALRAETDLLRRQAALWQAGIKPGPAAELFLDRLPDDVDLNDAEQVRLACARITSAVLGARDELAGVGS
jgi:hypothetical protein